MIEDRKVLDARIYARGYAAGKRNKQHAIKMAVKQASKIEIDTKLVATILREEIATRMPRRIAPTMPEIGHGLEFVSCCVCMVDFGMPKGRTKVTCPNGHSLHWPKREKKNA
ncbi:MAG: hypothetical protein V3W41_22335 [Planctomycetota bacterium]